MEITRCTITFDAADVELGAAFWAALFGGVSEGDHEWRVVRAPDGTVPVGVQLAQLHRVEPQWPGKPADTHLDLWVSDIDAAHDEVLAHGAELLQPASRGENFNVYASPSGHPFCLCWPVEQLSA